MPVAQFCSPRSSTEQYLFAEHKAPFWPDAFSLLMVWAKVGFAFIAPVVYPPVFATVPAVQTEPFPQFYAPVDTIPLDGQYLLVVQAKQVDSADASSVSL